MHDAERGGQGEAGDGRDTPRSNLQDFALTAAWPTPNAYGVAWADERSGKRKGEKLMGGLVGWETPTSETKAKSQRALMSSENNGRRSGGGQSSNPGLEQQAEMAAGLIPKELEGEHMDKTRKRLGERIDWLPCTDGKARPVEPGTFPLAHGIPGRVGRLRAYGNAIIPQVAAEFIMATDGCGDG